MYFKMSSLELVKKKGEFLRCENEYMIDNDSISNMAAATISTGNAMQQMHGSSHMCAVTVVNYLYPQTPRAVLLQVLFLHAKYCLFRVHKNTEVKSEPMSLL